LYYGEIDLLLISPEGDLVLVEVKSVKTDLSWRNPVSGKQKKVLRKSFEHLLASSHRGVRAHLIAVNQFDEVYMFEDFL